MYGLERNKRSLEDRRIGRRGLEPWDFQIGGHSRYIAITEQREAEIKASISIDINNFHNSP